MEEKMFSGSEPTWANACVGNNGNPGYFHYARGFSQAADRLIRVFFTEHEKNELDRLEADEVVYPICFNMRHAIELNIKGFIELLANQGFSRGLFSGYDLKSSHDIGLLWKFFKDKTKELDFRYRNYLNRIDAYIVDISNVDSTGQVFRYPYSNDEVKHLEDVRLINILSLYKKFIDIGKVFEKIENLTRYLIEEYYTGSYTKSIPRPLVFEILDTLPDIATWSTISPKEPINGVKQRYGLSGRDFDKVLEIAKSNFGMCRSIGLEKELVGIGIADIEWFFDICFRVNGREVYEETLSLLVDDDNNRKLFKRMVEREKEKSLIVPELLSNHTAERLAGLGAIYYLERDNEFFPELYEREYEYHLREVEVQSEPEIIDSYYHLIGKAHYCRSVVKGLVLIGCLSHARVLHEKYCPKIYQLDLEEFIIASKRDYTHTIAKADYVYM